MDKTKSNPVLRMTFEFSLAIIRFAGELEKERKYVIARQLLKSGTSIGANVMEAQNAESKADFVHKMKLAAKEAGETQYWLLLCEHSFRHHSVKHLLTSLEAINRILGKIISSAKRTVK